MKMPGEDTQRSRPHDSRKTDGSVPTRDPGQLPVNTRS